MGYKVRIQKVDRQSTSSYYVNFPVAVVEAIEASKSEEWEWCLEDRNTLVFKRSNPKPLRTQKADLTSP